MSLDCGRKPENPEETHTDTGRTCRLHTERTPVARPGNRTQALLAVRAPLKGCGVKAGPLLQSLGDECLDSQASVIEAGQASEQSTFLEATDVQFKAPYIFHINYPKECGPCMDLYSANVGNGRQ
ncbi:hypothetical protein MHYP_G00251160 [Metynnis hypsauchen]